MDKNELFIISVQRSGSNWLHRCLAEHQKIRINGELNVSAALTILDEVRAGDSVAQENLLALGVFKRAAQTYIKYLMRENTEKSLGSYKYLADKSAFPCVFSVKKNRIQCQYVDVLNKYFPIAKKILIIRDVRDSIVSFSEWRKQSIGNILAPNIRSFIFYIRFLRNWCLLHEEWLKDAENNSWKVITYEQMKTSFPDTMKSIFNYLELDVDQRFINQLTENLYSIDSPVYQAENKERGYVFFRKGEIGEWQEKFSWYHVLVYNIFFKKRVSNIYKIIKNSL